MSEFLNNLHTPVAPEWTDFLNAENKKLLKSIAEKTTRKNFTPPASRVLHFLTVPLSNVKTIILGQDPYPQAGVATGRAFEVGTLKDWNHTFRNVSLKNIIRLIYKTYYGEILPYKQIVDWNTDNKLIAGPQELFRNWEQQGVLLLNTAFTCETGLSNSHSKQWREFSQNLLEFINYQYPDLVWILWGGHAKKITENLDIKNKTRSHHPMMCSAKRKNDFLFGEVNTLDETKHLIDWRGI
ncbi:uracil-DNA glycosylase [Salinivirga cyanobacteriivorans]